MSALPKKPLPTKHLFSVEDWHRMGEMGFFLPDTRAELIEGEIIDMAPIGSSHAGHVNRLNHLFSTQIAGSAIVSVQNPVKLGNFSEPQPDMMVLRFDPHFYSKTHPTPDDVLLLIEVSDTTVRYDRNVKKPLYARYGIIEYWLVNLKDNCIEVYLKPQAQDYTLIHIKHKNEIIVPSQLPQITIAVSDVLG
jgi:Uma2 family endonuclease